MSRSRRFLIFIVIVMAVVVVAVLFRTQPSLKSILSTDVSKASNAQAASLPKPAVTTKKPEQPQASLKPKKKEELKPKPSSKPAARSLEATETPKEALKSKQKIQELEKQKAQLNLSLPDEWEAYEWDKPTKYSSYPNFFVPKEANKRFGVSGALHLDESEEAQQRTIDKNILGGEVELKWKLP